ncbi:MAG: WXG100 family type VII secretion target [Angustibacter sp.]
MAGFQISYNEAILLGQLMDDAGDSIREEVRTLENRLVSHYETWNGSAKNAYADAKEQWDAGLDKQHQALIDLKNLLNVNISRFDEVDQDNARKFGI